ncbi:MAG: 2,3-bisphosphoglycerate-independent phosphoglycerate mutase [Patescibacteria group bacterium]|jgi:2,3-bisphosphoglycerate-independent phosphoglycerate mutase
MSSNPVVLIIMDGWGVAAPSRGNTTTLARLPFFDYILANYPTMTLEAAGLSVGLPWGEMGNSEVGHLTIGSGRIVYQSLTRITQAIESGAFFKNSAFLSAIEHVKKNQSKLHLIGLLGLGGVHAHQMHMESLLQLAQDNGVPETYLHLFLDGRDAARNSATQYLEILQQRITEKKYGRIASLVGRYWAMDRDNKWERTKRAYDLLTAGTADVRGTDPMALIKESYQREVYDEEIEPTLITDGDQPVATIGDNDAVIYVNFRADRARQLTQAFVTDDFKGFERTKKLANLCFVTMTEYQKDLPVLVAYPREYIREPLAKVVSDSGAKQLHVAETEKYAHVTFFINGMQEASFPGEDRVLIPSPLVDSYAKTPSMSGQLITEAVVKGLNQGDYGLIIVNFANPDMVSHTGDIQASIAALEADDQYLKEIVTTALSHDGTVAITSDHGNCEEVMKLQTGELDKEHSTRPVPLIIINNQLQGKYPPITRDQMYTLKSRGTLTDVAPTVLGLMHLNKPKEMTGINLIKII